MENKPRTDVFIAVHKGLRRGLLNLSLKIGNLDWQDSDEVKAVEDEFKTMLHFLREHGEDEDLIQVPFLEKRSPGATKKMAEDHLKLEKEIDQLEERWKKTHAGVSSGTESGYAFYLSFNRFLADYLTHMDLEEQEVTEAIYQNFTDEEIQEEFKKILSRTSPQDMGMMLGYIIPSMNDAERLVFLSNLRGAAPPEVFAKVKGLAQKVLSPKDWQKLSKKLD